MSELNQYHLGITIQRADNHKLTDTQLDEIINQLSYDLSYALHGTLYHQIDKTNSIVQELNKALTLNNSDEFRDTVQSITEDYIMVGVK